ncbi:MAG TPA: MEDS domain-containing protein [Acidobacteriaceae bacterium]|nr:MEDS domain-containing protein [Acidobacteriaceae bacterium]
MAHFNHGDHICLMYDNAEQQRAIVVSFLREGLERGECCIFVADEHTTEEISALLTNAGIDARRFSDSGALKLTTKYAAYLRTGTFSPDFMIDFLGKSVDDAIQRGFSGIRGTAEMTWALSIGCERLVEYEAMLNRFIPQWPFIGLCQYNRRRFAPNILKGVLRTHPLYLDDDLYTNFYYEPPDIVLGKLSESDCVDWMIDHLKELPSAKRPNLPAS